MFELTCLIMSHVKLYGVQSFKLMTSHTEVGVNEK
jgi:hypothetical protein